MKLKAGTGYWSTEYYPIGGCFKRAPRDQDIEITNAEPMDTPFQGSNYTGLIDGKPVAFDINYTTP